RQERLYDLRFLVVLVDPELTEGKWQAELGEQPIRDAIQVELHARALADMQHASCADERQREGRRPSKLQVRETRLLRIRRRCAEYFAVPLIGRRQADRIEEHVRRYPPRPALEILRV